MDTSRNCQPIQHGIEDFASLHLGIKDSSVIEILNSRILPGGGLTVMVHLKRCDQLAVFQQIGALKSNWKFYPKTDAGYLSACEDYLERGVVDDLAAYRKLEY